MLEAGVQVVYFYIEDAHDNHVSTTQFTNCPSNPDGAFGPGEAAYVCQLQAYDAAFSKFFARLQKDGITPANTLFIMTADENDHFAGSVAAATPTGCNGITTPCTYPIGAKGEVDADLSLVYATEFGITTPFAVHSDDAPSVHINGKPASNAPQTRALEQKAALLLGFDPIIDGDSNVTQALADPAELALLHMITSDPNRTPSFILFGNPDYFLSASGHTAPPCTSSTATPPLDAKSCFVQSRAFAWNHGDFQNDIVQTWLGIVGPGVKNLGETGNLFTDHTDIRPTILSLTQLTDDYAHDGRVIFEIIADNALPVPLRGHTDTLTQLAEAYKQINAPTGPLGIATLTGISTQALAGDDPTDSTYSTLEAQIVNLTSQRNAIASQMIAMLENAAFNGQKIDEVAAKNLIAQAQALLNAVN
jgi:outer membrane murein-binding lipoprotein Lpp